MELKLFCGFPPTRRSGAFNWTYMELKPARRWAGRGVRQLLIGPIWN